ncbi:hypothetical protein BGZ51_004706 [Haplosporangium sp. Z 767]|nr:hypothetical protein BGZ51_004706 [Haplosporangium sp. Z 767]KAF9182909.1 hypothetical protein BGZ50_004641 [Haplosporangium sp. Z 11]
MCLSYIHPLAKPRLLSAQTQLLQQLLFKKQSPIYEPMPLTRPPRAILSNRTEPAQFQPTPNMNSSTSFTLQAAGVLSPRIKCQSDNKKESYTFQSRSDASNRNMTLKDHKSNQVCKAKNKGEHLLDLYLTTDSKDINVQFRDMIAFKKAVEKGGPKLPIYQPGDEDDERMDPRYVPESSVGFLDICWAFEFEGRIYQWSAAPGHGINAPPGSDVLICHTTSTTPPTKIAKLASSHTGASDKLVISNASTANVLDKTGLQILLLTSVLSLMEIMNDRSRELMDFD